jgi:hypothetical protein
MLNLIEPLVPAPVLSPLMLADRLLDLAKAADAAGMEAEAVRLLREVDRVLTPPARRAPFSARPSRRPSRRSG